MRPLRAFTDRYGGSSCAIDLALLRRIARCITEAERAKEDLVVAVAEAIALGRNDKGLSLASFASLAQTHELVRARDFLVAFVELGLLLVYSHRIEDEGDRVRTPLRVEVVREPEEHDLAALLLRFESLIEERLL